MSGITEKQSVISNIVIANMSGIHVTGTPPVFSNVKIVNSEEGITFLGSGPANEKDVTVKKLKMESVCIKIIKTILNDRIDAYLYI